MRRKPKNTLKLVYIEWCDACGWMGWDTIDGAKEEASFDRWLIRTSGWLLEETKEYLLIASDWQASVGHFNGFTKIPKTWIRKRFTIVEAEAEVGDEKV